MEYFTTLACLFTDGEKKVAAKELKFICKNLKGITLKSSGLFNGSCGVAMFLFYYSKSFNDLRSYNEAFKIVENIFQQDATLSEISLANGLLGLEMCLSFLHDARFVEIDEETIAAFNYIIRDCLYIDNLLDASISSGITGYCTYIISKAYRSSSDNVKEDEQYIELLKKILYYMELFFFSKLNCRTKFSENAGDEFYDNEIWYTYIPLLCSSSIVLGTDDIFKSRIQEASTALKEFYEKQNEASSQKVYEDLLFANSFYIASMYLNDKKLEAFSLKIVRDTITRHTFSEETNISLCGGLAGILTLYSRFYKWTHSSWLSNAMKDVFEKVIAELKAIRDPNKKITCGLMSGYAGIGISLLSIMYPCSSQWQHFLGVGWPPSDGMVS